MAQTASSGLPGTGFWDGLRNDWYALGWLALMQVVFVLAAWLVGSFIVPRREMNTFGQYERREGGGLGKAILLYFGYLVIAVVAFLVLKSTSTEAKLAFLSFFSTPLQLGAKWLVLFGVLIPLVAALKIALPMAIFRIRLLRALALLLLIVLLMAGLGWGLDIALHHPVKQRVQRVHDWADQNSGRSLLKSLAGQAKENVAFADAEHTAADATKPIAARKEAVRSMYTQLEQIRAAIAPGDTTASADYDGKMARYVALLKELRAEIAAHPELGDH